MSNGLLIGGDFDHLLARQKSHSSIELGTLLISENNESKFLLQVVNISYGSQISSSQIELVSGLKLEENKKVEFKDHNLRHYQLLHLKNLLNINKDSFKKARLSKKIPPFFSELREVEEKDFNFLPKEGLFLGKLRSGSKELDININLPVEKVLSHHVLLAATTGRGKSNLTSNIIYNCVEQDNVSMLVLDPHDEYYGRNSVGLKDHPKKENVIYYTLKNPPVGAKTLKINLSLLKPHYFNGVLNISEPQSDIMNMYYRRFKEYWIESIILNREIEGIKFNESSFNAIRRKLMSLLNIEIKNDEIICESVFDKNSGKTTISDIIKELEDSKIVIIDTSSFSGTLELLIGSLITSAIFNRYQYYKNRGELNIKPIVSIILEEAPRVLGKEVLERGNNIFATIAREGRKFKVGLYAITQLPSLIPRQILANMNTKIIMGIEMQPERESLIQSAAHDLSDYSKAIASLDKGEAIVSSNFSIFPMPIKVPLFGNLIDSKNSKEHYEQSLNGFSN